MNKLYRKILSVFDAVPMYYARELQQFNDRLQDENISLRAEICSLKKLLKKEGN